MVRSLYSGVAGMKSHQTRMDVIGNNIANVNSYGFKASRVTFRDMYYQNIRGASEATTNRGGLDPSSIGYGSTVGSVDLLMTQSAMTSTGNPLDVAITGEGFLQVMDNDGNIFYTKAGMLDIDSNGNLIDTNGYFVLGVSGDPLGQAAGSNKIQFTIPPVDPRASELSTSINGMNLTISATNPTKDGDVTMQFVSAIDLPIGIKAEAAMDGSNITIRLNSAETFSSYGELQNEVNAAITRANGGVPHPAGDFVINMDPDPFAGGTTLTGAELAGSNFGYIKGSVTVPDTFYNFGVSEVGDAFSSMGATNFTLAQTAFSDAGSMEFTVTVDVGGTAYTAVITEAQLASPNSIIVKNATAGASSEDFIEMTFPALNTLVAGNAGTGTTADPYVFGTVAGTVDSVASAPSSDVGLNSVLKLENGTEGGVQSIKDLTGISISADGTIVASHGDHGRLTIGRIDLATFDNPGGLQQSGTSYFAETSNSGSPSVTIPGENGSGALKNSALEMSNVDLSQEFSDMITTQRGFQANSRLITVSDTMLEELINLKR